MQTNLLTMVMLILHQWEIIQMAQALTARWIWQAMFGSGWQIGMVKHIMPVRSRPILWDPIQVNTECCGAARGTATMTSSVLTSAAGSARRLPTTASVFVVPAHHSSKIL